MTYQAVPDVHPHPLVGHTAVAYIALVLLLARNDCSTSREILLSSPYGLVVRKFSRALVLKGV